MLKNGKEKDSRIKNDSCLVNDIVCIFEFIFYTLITTDECNQYTPQKQVMDKVTQQK